MKYLFLFLTFVISLNLNAQSKKEQIAVLNKRVDSLTTALSITKYNASKKAQDLSEEINILMTNKTVIENDNKSLQQKNIELSMELNKLRDSIAIVDVRAKYQGVWCYDKKWESDGEMLEISIANSSAFVDFGAANYFENLEVVYNANGSALFYLSFVSGSIGFMQSQGDAMNERINERDNLAYSSVLIEANKIKIGEMELIKLKPNQGCGKFK